MLAAEDVVVAFGGVRAVSGVTLRLERSEILGLVGPNGSGKTTLLNAISGVVPASGHLRVSGHLVPLGRPGASWRAGVARVFQAPQVFEELSCLEDVLLASPDRDSRGLFGAWLARPRMWKAEDGRVQQGRRSLDQVGLSGVVDVRVGQLSYGQRRLLELARALNGRRQVVLLDEPSAGLNDVETSLLCQVLLAVRDTGLPLLVVDHKIDFLTRLCDRVIVLQLGEAIAEGPPEIVWQDARVRRAYLGE